MLKIGKVIYELLSNNTELQKVVNIVDDEYEGSVQVAELVRKAIEHKRGKIADFTVEDITIEDAVEEFVDNAFIQELTIKIEIQNED